MTTLSKPYKHHDKRRVRIRDAEGWRWGPSAETPEAAVAAAQAAMTAPTTLAAQNRPEPVLAPATRTAADGVRVDGPHRHRAGWWYRVITSADRRWAPVGSTEVKALRLAKLYAAKGTMPIRDTTDAFLAANAQVGIRTVPIDGYRAHLGRFFRTDIDRPLDWLTLRRAQQLYDSLRSVGRRGRRYSIATQRTALRVAKIWSAWVRERGWTREDVLAKVRGVGTSSRGKLQRTIDEARQLYAVCLTRAGEGDAGALAALLAVAMGLRASEIVTRTVRDIDDGGKVLRIGDNVALGFKTKSQTSSRSLRLPADLRPLLAQHAAGKKGTALLFVSAKGEPHRRQWVWQCSRRLCRDAGVPLVCPHGLRGVAASAAAAAGALPGLVAAMLGHNSIAVTMNHYIKPGTVEAAQLERGYRSLTDGS